MLNRQFIQLLVASCQDSIDNWLDNFIDGILNIGKGQKQSESIVFSRTSKLHLPENATTPDAVFIYSVVV